VSGPRRCGGQASTEYTVLLVLVVVVLLASVVEPSPVAALAAAIRRAWQGFSYVISFAV
jgi:Flp pilus assembly pilin Flp